MAPWPMDLRITKPGAPQYQNMAGLDSKDANWATESTDRWKETVQSAVHGVTSLTAPSVGSISPTGYYASSANVIIVNEKPTSVICDAINLLSDRWNDANSALSVDSRNANNTTFNTAIITGIDTSTVGGYNRRA